MSSGFDKLRSQNIVELNVTQLQTIKHSTNTYTAFAND